MPLTRARRPAQRLLVLALAGVFTTPVSCRDEQKPPTAPEGRTAKPEGKVRVVPQMGMLAPRRVAFAPDGSPRLAVIEADGTVSVWLVDNPEQPRCFSWIYTDAAEAVFAADGNRILSAGRDGAISVWTVAGQLQRRIPDAHPGGVRALAAGAAMTISGGADGAVRLWNSDASPRGAALIGHTGAVLSVALSKQGQVASFGIDQTVRLWSPAPDGVYRETAAVNLETQRFTKLLPNLLQLDVNWGWGRAVAFDPSGALLAVAPFDGTVRALRNDGTAVGKPLQGHGGLQAQSIAFAADGSSIVSAGHDGRLQMWHPDGRLGEQEIQAHDAPVVGVDQSKQGAMIASAGTDGVVRLWDSTGKRLGQLPVRHDRIHAIAVDHGATTVAVGDSRGEIWLWDRDAHQRGRLISGYDRQGTAMTFSPAGDRLASGCANNAVCVWDLAESSDGDGEDTAHIRLVGHVSASRSIAFAPSGDAVAAGTAYGALLLWRGQQAGPGKALEGTRGLIGALAFSPDGKAIAAASQQVRLWSLDQISEAVEGHGGPALAVAFAPGGEIFASGGADGLVRLWRRDATALGEPLGGHAGQATALAFTTDDELLSGGADGKLRIWNVGARRFRQIDVGPPITAVGRAGRLTWVITRRDEIHFYGSDESGVSERPMATMLFAPATAVVVRSDGSSSGEGDPPIDLLAFDAQPAQTMSPASADGIAGTIDTPNPDAAGGHTQRRVTAQ